MPESEREASNAAVADKPNICARWECKESASRKSPSSSRLEQEVFSLPTVCPDTSLTRGGRSNGCESGACRGGSACGSCSEPAASMLVLVLVLVLALALALAAGRGRAGDCRTADLGSVPAPAPAPAPAAAARRSGDVTTVSSDSSEPKLPRRSPTSRAGRSECALEAAAAAAAAPAPAIPAIPAAPAAAAAAADVLPAAVAVAAEKDDEAFSSSGVRGGSTTIEPLRAPAGPGVAIPEARGLTATARNAPPLGGAPAPTKNPEPARRCGEPAGGAFCCSQG